MTSITSEGERRSSHSDALLLQGRIIGALAVHELQSRFGRMHLGLVWLLVEPVVYAAMFTVFRQWLGKTSPIGTSLEVFVFTGMMPYFLVRNLSTRVIRGLDAEDTTRALPVVTYLDVVASRVLLEVVIFMAAIVVWLTALGLLGFQWYPDDPLGFVSAFGALVLLGVGGGVLNAVVATYVPVWAKIAPWIVRIAMFTSGALILVTHLPPNLLWYIKWNPLFHGVEWVRSAFYAEYHSAHLDTVYLLFHGGVLLLAGLLLERTLKRKPTFE